MNKLESERVITLNGIPFRDTNLKNNVLEKDNKAEYTPSEDYNPATKKYVDDSTLTIINDTISSLTTAYSSKRLNDIFGDIQKILDEINSNKTE